MVNSGSQVSQIVEKLLDKTLVGTQKWAASLISDRYQARIGNFTVELQGHPYISALVTTGTGTPNYNARIKITKLDGSVVAEFANGQVLRSVSSATTLVGFDMVTQERLNKLYGLLLDRNADLDELLGLI